MSEGDTEVITTDATEEASVSESEIFSDMLRHMMAPLLIGMVFGAIWELTVMPRIEPNFAPNPVHGAFAIYLIASPLFYKLLLDMEMNRAGEYAMGFAVTACFLSLIWMLGSSLYLGGFLPCIGWLFISSFWLQFEFPPFRYGLWHGMAVNVGAFGGSVLAFIYL